MNVLAKVVYRDKLGREDGGAPPANRIADKGLILCRHHDNNTSFSPLFNGGTIPCCYIHNGKLLSLF